MRARRIQRVARWEQAERELGELIERAAGGLAPGRAPVVGITGPVGSGKTTLASRVACGRGAVVLSTDHYLPDYELLPEGDRDDPDHADLGLLAAHLGELAAGWAVDRPVWCFQAHRRVGVERVGPGPLVVCEGIFALHPMVRAGVDVAVYVDAPAATRWERWEQIEAAGERGWGVEHARRYFTTVAEPTFARFAPAYRSAADLVVINDGG